MGENYLLIMGKLNVETYKKQPKQYIKVFSFKKKFPTFKIKK